MNYEETDLYAYGKALYKLGSLLMSERTEIAELVDAANDAGVRLLFRVVPINRASDCSPDEALEEK
jgi:hypothetical protein